jgi:hypothetical protein
VTAIALRRAMLCLNDEWIYPCGQVCPACGSANGFPLAAWLDSAEEKLERIKIEATLDS